MNQATSRSRIAKTITLLTRLGIAELVDPVLSENDFADADLEVDASMDHRIPGDASADLLRQAQRCLFRYIAWLDKGNCSPLSSMSVGGIDSGIIL